MNQLLLQAETLTECAVFDCDVPRRGMIGVTGGDAAFLKLFAKKERFMGVFHYYYNGAPVYVRGGNYRRLVKALTAPGELFLLDGPLAGLSAREEEEILNLIRERNEDGATFVVAAEDLAEFAPMLTSVLDAASGRAQRAPLSYCPAPYGYAAAGY